MDKTMQQLASELADVRKSLSQSASGDGMMYAQQLERELAALYLSENDSLIDLECRWVVDGKVTPPVMDVIWYDEDDGTVTAKRAPYEIWAPQEDFAYLIAGHWIRLFWGNNNG